MINKTALGFVACLLSSICAHAQVLQVAGITTEKFDSYAVSQDGDKLCWAASIQMILNFHGIDINQNEIEMNTFGEVVNHTGTDQDISRALQGWAVGLDGHKKLVTSLMKSGLPEPSVLINQLSQGRPILLALSGAYIGHAVVITGATYLPGPQIQSLIIRDPYPSPTNIQSKGRVEIGGPQLDALLKNKAFRNYWLVSVKDVASPPAPNVSSAPPKHSASVPVVKAAEPSPAADDQSAEVENKDPEKTEKAVSDALRMCDFDHQDCVEAIDSDERCMQKYVTGCIKSCIEDFHIAPQECKDQRCNPDTLVSNYMENGCAKYKESKTAICRSKRHTCRQTAMNATF